MNLSMCRLYLICPNYEWQNSGRTDLDFPRFFGHLSACVRKFAWKHAPESTRTG